MKKGILLFSFLTFFLFLNGQESIDLNPLKEALITNGVYTPQKNYKYQVTKLDAKGDILSKEVVYMRIPTELNTEAYDNGRVNFIWEYPNHETYETTLSPTSKAITGYDWVSADTTTLSFDEQLYLHPMRDNQYYQTEVSAHPSIKFSNLEDGKYETKIVILNGFGKYKMQEYLSKHTVIGKRDFKMNEEVVDCYEITAETTVEGFSFGSSKGKRHEIFGEAEVINKTTSLVSGKYGFVKIHYEFYDGEQLFMEMVEF